MTSQMLITVDITHYQTRIPAQSAVGGPKLKMQCSEKGLPKRLPIQRGRTRIQQEAKHCDTAAIREEQRRKTEAERQEAEGGRAKKRGKAGGHGAGGWGAAGVGLSTKVKGEREFG